MKYKELRAPSSPEDSAAVRARAIAARPSQTERFKTEKTTYCNAQMAPKMIRKHSAINADGEKLPESAVTRLRLSARTIADLDGSENIPCEHVSEAIQSRTLDRDDWA